MDLWTMTLMVFLCIVALATTRTKDLLGSVMLLSVFSLISALLFVTLDAPDVAATEAVVGAGLSTILMLMALRRLPRFVDDTPSLSWTFLLLLITMVGLLLFGMLQAPYFGGSSPLHEHALTSYYPEHAEKTGIQNLVTAILAIYRAFDTLGETLVILIAAIGTIMLLVPRYIPVFSTIKRNPSKDIPLLATASRFFIPVILLFAFYVQTHGESGPGGGFQAGVLFAAAFLLYHLIANPDGQDRHSFHWFLLLGAGGFGLYIVTGLAGIFLDGHFLSYKAFGHSYKEAMHLGVFLIEISVGLTVASSVSLLLSAVGYCPSGVFIRHLFMPIQKESSPQKETKMHD